MSKRYAIKDVGKDWPEYYRQNPSKNGWYSDDVGDARLYSSPDQAMKTIMSGNHHVSYNNFGTRTLKVIEVLVVDVSESREREK